MIEVVPQPLLIALTGASMWAIVGCDRSHYPTDAQRDAWIDEQRARLEAGDNDVFLYNSVNTDVLLDRISGMPQVERLGFEGTADLSETGLRLLKTFPNLRHLSFRGEPAVSDATFRHICECTQLQSLSLYCTKVTGPGLKSIGKLANLRTLEMQPWDNAPKVSDEHLLFVGELKSLERLELHGWASDTAVAELKERLPDCEVRNARW